MSTRYYQDRFQALGRAQVLSRKHGRDMAVCYEPEEGYCVLFADNDWVTNDAIDVVTIFVAESDNDEDRDNAHTRDMLRGRRGY